MAVPDCSDLQVQEFAGSFRRENPPWQGAERYHHYFVSTDSLASLLRLQKPVSWETATSLSAINLKPAGESEFCVQFLIK